MPICGPRPARVSIRASHIVHIIMTNADDTRRTQLGAIHLQ